MTDPKKKKRQKGGLKWENELHDSMNSFKKNINKFQKAKKEMVFKKQCTGQEEGKVKALRGILKEYKTQNKITRT